MAQPLSGTRMASWIINEIAVHWFHVRTTTLIGTSRPSLIDILYWQRFTWFTERDSAENFFSNPAGIEWMKSGRVMPVPTRTTFINQRHDDWVLCLPTPTYLGLTWTFSFETTTPCGQSHRLHNKYLLLTRTFITLRWWIHLPVFQFPFKFE